MQPFSQNRTKKLTTLAMLIAMAFMVGATFRIRHVFAAAPFLTYDPKDVVILIGGFLFGPVSALLMSVILAFLEMATVSVTGFIGAIMNALASASFACTAAFVYSKRRNIQGAVVGLALGCVVATATMLLWNYAIIPLYVPGATRESVMAMMIPVLLPFNLIKTSLNAAIALLLYKKVVAALKAAGLYAEQPTEKTHSRTLGRIVTVSAAVIAIALIVLLLVIRNS
ncbi:MAG: ECF transporter S component [Defluviitaleaceae bacterium]|nr:ECF transporter S component [Defluviitaleaceae bacterium]MCL2263106.1 ECF transporter S component [Defluviitaleaceae bacterium]